RHGSSGAELWDAKTGERVGRAFGDALGGGLIKASFSRDGRRVLTADHPWRARVFDARTGSALFDPSGYLNFDDRLTPHMEHETKVVSAAFSPAGRLVVTASWDNTARVWEATTGRPVTPLLRHGNWVEDASFSPDGRLVVTASGDGTARVWDARTGAPTVPPL